MNLGKIVAHAPYTMNLCSAKRDIRNFSKEMIADDMKRMEYIPAIIIIFIRVHTGQGSGDRHRIYCPDT